MITKPKILNSLSLLEHPFLASMLLTGDQGCINDYRNYHFLWFSFVLRQNVDKLESDL